MKHLLNLNDSFLKKITLLVLMSAVFAQPIATSFNILAQPSLEIGASNSEDSEGKESKKEESSEEEKAEKKYVFSEVAYTAHFGQVLEFEFLLVASAAICQEIPLPPPDLA